jgi:hypothetical protein
LHSKVRVHGISWTGIPSKTSFTKQFSCIAPEKQIHSKCSFLIRLRQEQYAYEMRILNGSVAVTRVMCANRKTSMKRPIICVPVVWISCARRRLVSSTLAIPQRFLCNGSTRKPCKLPFVAYLTLDIPYQALFPSSSHKRCKTELDLQCNLLSLSFGGNMQKSLSVASSLFSLFTSWLI